MSAVVLGPEPAAPPDVGLRSLPTISLAEVVAEADLQTRVDRKYLVDRVVFDRLIEERAGSLRCLTIDGRVRARYRSVYFDTAGLAFFHQHLQGRRRRYKVRTRSYLDSAMSVLEVKAKGLGSTTVKRRVPWPDVDSHRLSVAGDAFVAEAIGSDTYRGALAPTLETHYLRSTLVDEASQSRITCDTVLRFRHGAVEAAGHDDEVLIETKSLGGPCPTDRWLQAHRIRPTSMSKYCLGVALVHPHVRANPWHRVLKRHFDWSRR